MNSKLKTLLVLSGAALLSVPALRAQSHGFSGARGGVASRSAAGGHSAFAGRPAGHVLANNASFGGSRTLRGGGYYRGGYHHGYGRYYYLGGIPYFYPYGFGFGGFYGDGFYGDGFYGGGYAGGPYGAGAGEADGGAYEGRITNGRNGQSTQNGGDAQGSGPSLPSAVQRQLAKRGYYKGAVDGEFGPATRDALKRFQKSQGLKATGSLNEDSLDALGFTDRR